MIKSLLFMLSLAVIAVACSGEDGTRSSVPVNQGTSPGVSPVESKYGDVSDELARLTERLELAEQRLATVEAQNGELAVSQESGQPTLAAQVAINLPTPQPTSAPLYWPTPEDFNVLAFNRIADMERSEGRQLVINFNKFKDQYWRYAVVYVASACVDSINMLFDGFREFLSRTLILVRRADNQPRIKIAGEDAISQIIKIANEIPNLGPSSEMPVCMRRYLFPASYSDASPATELVKIFFGSGTLLGEVTERIMDRTLYRQFDLWENQGRPFIPWLCEQLKPDDWVSCHTK